VEKASRLGYSAKRRELAWSRVSFVLDRDLKIQTSRRAEGCQQRGSRPDLSNGCRESDLMGSEPTRTAFRSPWQNGVAERWVGSCRRDLLDHVIVLNERHLKRLMSSYLLYYHEDRTHLGLAKDTPAGRATEICSAGGSKIQSFPRLGGLHHRYAVAA